VLVTVDVETVEAGRGVSLIVTIEVTVVLVTGVASALHAELILAAAKVTRGAGVDRASAVVVAEEPPGAAPAACLFW